MPEFVTVSKKRRRYTFGRAHDLIEIPNMIEIQRDSYRRFYQDDVPADKRQLQGLQELLCEVFPIESYDGQFKLEFIRYHVDAPVLTEAVARQRDMTWARPIRATIRLTNNKTGEMKEEEIFLSDFPVMTDRGTFIINGTERVVINQLARSAGVYFSKEESTGGEEVCSAKIIPDRGAWLEFFATPGDIATVNIDNRRKLPMTLLMKAFGAKNNDEIIRLMGAEPEFKSLDDSLKGMLAAESVHDGGVSVTASGRPITREALDRLRRMNREGVKVYPLDPSLALTMEKETTQSVDEAMQEIFRRLRPNEPARVENAREYVRNMFLDPRRYTLGRVGRYKMNRRLGLNISEDERLLTLDDIVAIAREMFALRDLEKKSDDIDHLGNRRVRSIGELLQNQLRIGLLRMERIARERMTTIPNLSATMGRELINVRPIAAALREFFGSGQLSQFMDQTNPLAEVTHRRRLSALGPGGLSRERAGFEARDVHYTHYGRVCPIETPEGPNIGLVSSLTTYAKLNDYGFLITPRCEVKDGKLTGEIEFLAADEEDQYHVAMASTPLAADGKTLVGRGSEVPGSFPINIDGLDVDAVLRGLLKNYYPDYPAEAEADERVAREKLPALRGPGVLPEGVPDFPVDELDLYENTVRSLSDFADIRTVSGLVAKSREELREKIKTPPGGDLVEVLRILAKRAVDDVLHVLAESRNSRGVAEVLRVLGSGSPVLKEIDGADEHTKPLVGEPLDEAALQLLLGPGTAVSKFVLADAAGGGDAGQSLDELDIPTKSGVKKKIVDAFKAAGIESVSQVQRLTDDRLGEILGGKTGVKSANFEHVKNALGKLKPTSANRREVEVFVDEAAFRDRLNGKALIGDLPGVAASGERLSDSLLRRITAPCRVVADDPFNLGTLDVDAAVRALLEHYCPDAAGGDVRALLAVKGTGVMPDGVPDFPVSELGDFSILRNAGIENVSELVANSREKLKAKVPTVPLSALGLDTQTRRVLEIKNHIKTVATLDDALNQGRRLVQVDPKGPRWKLIRDALDKFKESSGYVPAALSVGAVEAALRARGLALRGASVFSADDVDAIERALPKVITAVLVRKLSDMSSNPLVLKEVDGADEQTRQLIGKPLDEAAIRLLLGPGTAVSKFVLVDAAEDGDAGRREFEVFVDDAAFRERLNDSTPQRVNVPCNVIANDSGALVTAVLVRKLLDCGQLVIKEIDEADKQTRPLVGKPLDEAAVRLLFGPDAKASKFVLTDAVEDGGVYGQPLDKLDIPATGGVKKKIVDALNAAGIENVGQLKNLADDKLGEIVGSKTGVKSANFKHVKDAISKLESASANGREVEVCVDDAEFSAVRGLIAKQPGGEPVFTALDLDEIEAALRKEGLVLLGAVVFSAEDADAIDESWKKKATPIPVGGVVVTRHQDDIESIPVEDVDYMDVSPKQIVSSSTALIPFLEHDDANRALMGSNMQRQAVPLIFPDAPRVGTGIEHRIAKDSGSCVVAKRPGVVTWVDSEYIKVLEDGDEKEVMRALNEAWRVLDCEQLGQLVIKEIDMADELTRPLFGKTLDEAALRLLLRPGTMVSKFVLGAGDYSNEVFVNEAAFRERLNGKVLVTDLAGITVNGRNRKLNDSILRLASAPCRVVAKGFNVSPVIGALLDNYYPDYLDALAAGRLITVEELLSVKGSGVMPYEVPNFRVDDLGDVFTRLRDAGIESISDLIAKSRAELEAVVNSSPAPVDMNVPIGELEPFLPKARATRTLNVLSKSADPKISSVADLVEARKSGSKIKDIAKGGQLEQDIDAALEKFRASGAPVSTALEPNAAALPASSGAVAAPDEVLNLPVGELGIYGKCAEDVVRALSDFAGISTVSELIAKSRADLAAVANNSSAPVDMDVSIDELEPLLPKARATRILNVLKKSTDPNISSVADLVQARKSGSKIKDISKGGQLEQDIDAALEQFQGGAGPVFTAADLDAISATLRARGLVLRGAEGIGVLPDGAPDLPVGELGIYGDRAEAIVSALSDFAGISTVSELIAKSRADLAAVANSSSAPVDMDVPVDEQFLSNANVSKTNVSNILKALRNSDPKVTTVAELIEALKSGIAGINKDGRPGKLSHDLDAALEKFQGGAEPVFTAPDLDAIEAALRARGLVLRGTEGIGVLPDGMPDLPVGELGIYSDRAGAVVHALLDSAGISTVSGLIAKSRADLAAAVNRPSAPADMDVPVSTLEPFLPKANAARILNVIKKSTDPEISSVADLVQARNSGSKIKDISKGGQLEQDIDAALEKFKAGGAGPVFTAADLGAMNVPVEKLEPLLPKANAARILNVIKKSTDPKISSVADLVQARNSGSKIKDISKGGQLEKDIDAALEKFKPNAGEPVFTASDLDAIEAALHVRGLALRIAAETGVGGKPEAPAASMASPLTVLGLDTQTRRALEVKNSIKTVAELDKAFKNRRKLVQVDPRGPRGKHIRDALEKFKKTLGEAKPETPESGGFGVDAIEAALRERGLVLRGAAVFTAADAGEIERALSGAEVITALLVRELPGGARKTYDLIKFRRSNQGTLIHQRPLVRKNERVDADQVIADGQSMDEGELALGQNVVVAFVPWEGYNFEDAILLNENLVKHDKFSSIHIEEYETEARETKLGPEEITRDIPNVGEDMLRNLDEDGVIRIGAEVNAGDILVGKVTPKGESEQTPEEKLLRAIFGEKAREVRDNSLKLPHGARGKIVAVKQMTRETAPEALSPGVLRAVKVYVAQWRKITVGDKMAGRHGNKGVVSRILPVEDMPYLPDGTPVDVVLNPLGVPSRMNLGQVLETIMGFVALNNGWHVATPVFEGAKSEEIFEELGKLAAMKYPDLTEHGMITLRDGRTGEPMEKKVTVGCMYMLKLIHLVDDKIHARSTGPYSLITQQPLGGKAQFGGQRFGEMEVWALEGYGAANVLQEILTVKSDDIRGRDKTYESIVKGQNLVKPGVPESFRVLVKELQGLGLDVEVQYDDGTMGNMDSEDEDEMQTMRPRREIMFEGDTPEGRIRTYSDEGGRGDLFEAEDSEEAEDSGGAEDAEDSDADSDDASLTEESNASDAEVFGSDSESDKEGADSWAEER
ncbi:MAG: hypothetical protein LBR38_02110 [Synergistaceae bacterium]|nr:hypothetical protein [Synergistaceae bacterium]